MDDNHDSPQMKAKKILPFMIRHLGLIIIMACVFFTSFTMFARPRRHFGRKASTDYLEVADNSSRDLLKLSVAIESRFQKFTSEDIFGDLSRSKLPNSSVIMEYINIREEFNIKPPLNFFENITNPCWLDINHAHRNVTRCLPYFYLAGFPKCGTTDLWQRLASLPGVVRLHGPQGIGKEPHWWTKTRFKNKNNEYAHGGNLIHYTRFFKNIDISSDIQQVVGDGSASTLWDDYETHDRIVDLMMSPELLQSFNDYQLHAIHLIKAYTPGAKFILIVRDPVDRLYSDYLYFTGEVPFTNTFNDSIYVSQEEFHYKFLLSLEEMNACLSEYGARRCAYDQNVRYNAAARNVRLQVGMYVVFIHNLLLTMPRENVLVINLSEYSQLRSAVLERVCRFLGLDWDDESINIMNSVEIANARRSKRRIGEMWAETRKLIQEFYRPFNQALAMLLNDQSYLFEK